MNNQKLIALFCLSFLFAACSHNLSSKDVSPDNGEKHFKSLTQLTFEGTNAEAYFSPDGKSIIFQGHNAEQKCDQIFTMNVDGKHKTLISTHGGRNTCSFFIDPNTILFSSTHKQTSECPAERDKSKGYVWEIYKNYDIYRADASGNILGMLTTTPGYDAESTVCGDQITFTSARDGKNVSVYTMNTDGKNVKRLTSKIGYSGGPFFSPNCKQIVYRAFYPKTKLDQKKFQHAVSSGYIPPGALEIWVMNSDGSNQKQLTHLGASSFAPSFFADGKRIIYSTNGVNQKAFQLHTIDTTHSGKEAGEAITAIGSFNGFPMFSPDGKYLLFASNRNSSNPHELQIFLAEWQD